MRLMVRWVGLTVAVLGGVLGASVAAGGPAAGVSPSLALDRSAGLLDGQLVTVKGSGISPGSSGGVVECSDAPAQPTIDIGGQAAPVSCSNPFGGGFLFVLASSPVADASGTFELPFVVHTGIVGPPALGVDSIGHNSAADAAAYPCPPTAAQQSTGVTCSIRWGDLAGDRASAGITFGPPAPTSPVISVTPTAGLASGQPVTVTGSGFTPLSPVVVSECNLSAGEPAGNFGLAALPLGCTPPPGQVGPVPWAAPVVPQTDTAGRFSLPFTIAEGNIGLGLDTFGYPCPPTPAQQSGGAVCALVAVDGAYNTATATLNITGAVSVPTVRVFPSGGLINGNVVAVEGWGFAAGTPGGVLECNDAPGQPTVPIDGTTATVGCSDPYNGGVITVAPDGTVSTTFPVHTGVVGPPQPGPDSAGNDGVADAANYPCPPTAAQLAAGVSCVILVGDLAANAARIPIGFASGGPGGPANPEVALAADPSGGRWALAGDGGVFTSAGAPFLGSLPASGVRPAAPITGIAITRGGRGYWLVGADGGVFTFGDAAYLGSLPGQRIRPAAPIVAITETPTGRGYWLAAADGGIFTFGDASWYGSLPAAHTRPTVPITGFAITRDSNGYWLSSADGHIYAFGDAATP